MSIDKDTLTSHPNPKSHHYLYGVSVLHFAGMNYIEAIEEKIRLAKIHYRFIEHSSMEETEEFTAAQLKEAWLKDISDAIEHNTHLLNEYKTEYKNHIRKNINNPIPYIGKQNIEDKLNQVHTLLG